MLKRFCSDLMLAVMSCCLLVMYVAAADMEGPEAGSADSRRVALLIGNSAYPVPLLDPSAAFERFAGVLRELGFEVVSLQDADKKRMVDAIRDFGNRLADSSIALFYFSGYVAQIEGQNQLIPLGVDLQDDIQIQYEGIGLDRIIYEARPTLNRATLVLLDGYSNPGPAGAGLVAVERIDDYANTLVSFSTAAGVAVAVPGDGVYLEQLISALQQDGVPVSELFERVRQQVAGATGGVQQPWFASSLEQDLVLRAAAPQAVATTPAGVAQRSIEPPSAPLSEAADPIEQAFWETVQYSDNPAELQAYLDQFPEGHYAATAQRRIQELSTPVPSSGTLDLTEIAFWDTVKNSDDPALLRAYLEQYPRGHFKTLAEIKLRRLERTPQADKTIAMKPGPELSKPSEPPKPAVESMPAMLSEPGPESGDLPAAGVAALSPPRDSAAMAPLPAADAAEIEELLNQAARALERKRLTTPAEDNAVKWAEQVLKRQPGNSAAQQVLGTVIDKYLLWSDSNLRSGRLRKASANLAKARSIRQYANATQADSMDALEQRIGRAQRTARAATADQQADRSSPAVADEPKQQERSPVLRFFDSWGQVMEGAGGAR